MVKQSLAKFVLCLQVIGDLMPVPDLSALRCRAWLLEMFAIPVTDMPAENGNECKPDILSTLAYQADTIARGDMATLSVPSLSTGVVAGRAAGVDDICGPTPTLPLYVGMRRWRITSSC